ncbi:MAG: hypothetical protein HY876_11085 [Coriobacteriales bacterium]|nr:hypothetical protein [Coriobacteriales bacterium]
MIDAGPRPKRARVAILAACLGAVITFGSGVPAASAMSALPCDHRYGASATWTHSSDGLRTKTAFLPEMLAFQYGAGFTVFESASNAGRPPLSARKAAYRTGRLRPSLYFRGDLGGPAELAAESRWFYETFGRWPSALSYAKGVDDDSYAVTKYVFGARNSRWEEQTAYGMSRENAGTALGNPWTEFLPDHASSMPSSTRFHDMAVRETRSGGDPNPYYDMPLSEVISATVDVAESAVAARGWYTDFTHWSGPSGPQLTSFVSAHMDALDAAGTPVARIPYDVAAQHAFLRDSAECALTANPDGSVHLTVGWSYPYANPPLRAVSIPLSVNVDLEDTALEGHDIDAIGDAGIQKIGDDEYVVEVPFRREGSAVRLVATTTPAYDDLTPPSVEVTSSGTVVRFTTNRPTKAVLFVATAQSQNALAAEVVWRSSGRASSHQVDMATGQTYVGANVQTFSSSPNPLRLYLGVMDARGRSALVPVNEGSADTLFVGVAPSVRVPYRSSTLLSARLLDAGATPLPARPPAVQMEAAPGTWKTVATAVAIAGTPGSYRARIVPGSAGPTRYRFRFYGDSVYESATSRVVTTMPCARLSVSVPRNGRSATVSIAPAHRGARIVMEVQRRSGGRWRRARTLIRTTSNRSLRVALGVSRGSYRIRATHADATHARSFSPWRTFRVP